MTREPDKRVCLGVVASAHGVRGDVKIKPFTETPEGPAAYGVLEDKARTRRFEIITSRVSGNTLVAHFEGVDDRNAAEALKGVELYADRTQLPDPDEDSWYFADLIGLAVYDIDGTQLGTVIAIHNFGAGDVIEIRPQKNGPSGLVPFTRDQVPEVNVAGGRIVVAASADPFKPTEPDAPS